MLPRFPLSLRSQFSPYQDFRLPPAPSYRKVDKEDLKAIALKEYKILRYETLVAATKKLNLKNKLSKGGFGPVFRGQLLDGREVAVKKLGPHRSYFPVSLAKAACWAWASCLPESDRKLLSQFLPRGIGSIQAVQSLLKGENLHFRNQFTKWQVILNIIYYFVHVVVFSLNLS
ncbi:cysteine-rich receptor-like protein kinase 10 [Carex littledalei]|uniref:Cysteine-rich receptor-like protein kinase 10 n=1 Tax=Carex littledalei TaxID=544730 RepID=A0A833R158_9POAL|nr:cysteine-rich receptor-like protein kinase 10 [Carex littledalei]